MAAGSAIKRVLLLFAEDQANNAGKLKAVLQSESCGIVEVVDLVDIAVENLSLEKKLKESDSVLLICSNRVTELIDKETEAVFNDENGTTVCFDGKLLSKTLKDENGNLREKLIPVAFVELPSFLGGTKEKKSCSPVCFGVKQGKVTEKMLEGEIMTSLIAIIKGKSK